MMRCDASMDIIQELINCKDISVVLRNRTSQKQYVESYLLKNIVLLNGKFWGKFSNVHPPFGHNGLSKSNMIAYAYNNFSPLVCTMSLPERMERYYSTEAYSELRFIANCSYKKIWSGPSGGYNSAIQEAVVSGLKMKVLIESLDGYVYIMPLHTFEVYEKEKEFVAESEFDGYPELLRSFDKATYLGERLQELKRLSPHLEYASTGYEFSKPYFLSSFLITNNKILKRDFTGGDEYELNEYTCGRVEIWAEVQ